MLIFKQSPLIRALLVHIGHQHFGILNMCKCAELALELEKLSLEKEEMYEDEASQEFIADYKNPQYEDKIAEIEAEFQRTQAEIKAILA